MCWCEKSMDWIEMAKRGSSKRGFALGRRVVALPKAGLGLVRKVGKNAFSSTGRIFNSVSGFAERGVGAVGNAANEGLKGTFGSKKSRRNRRGPMTRRRRGERRGETRRRR